jgi:hypothetical protein
VGEDPLVAKLKWHTFALEIERFAKCAALGPLPQITIFIFAYQIFWKPFGSITVMTIR